MEKAVLFNDDLRNLGNKMGHTRGSLLHPKDESVQITVETTQLTYATYVTRTYL